MSMQEGELTMELFTDNCGHDVPFSEIKDVHAGIDTCQATGLFMPDNEGPCSFTVELADGTTRRSKEYPDAQSAAAAQQELKVALRERRD
jgi:hypothetical protein